MFGGDGIRLYVTPSNRGLGIALCIVAAICADIRSQGGHYLQASYDPALARLYERVGVGRPECACHVSALAFDACATKQGLKLCCGRSHLTLQGLRICLDGLVIRRAAPFELSAVPRRCASE